jgi:hypothetical protein
MLTLQVSAEARSKVIVRYDLYSSNFLGGNENSTWHSFPIRFVVKDTLKNVEFTGLEPSSNYDIYLAFILIEKTG